MAPLTISFKFNAYYIHTIKKRGANLLLVPHSEGLRIALFVETSNDGSPTWMRKYMIPLNASCAK